MEDFVDFGKFESSITIIKNHQSLFIDTVSNFFKCHVELNYFPQEKFYSEYGLNVIDNPNRNVYILNDEKALIFIFAQAKKYKLTLGVILEKPQIELPPSKLLNQFAATLSKRLEIAIRHHYKVDLQHFGKKLLYKSIYKFIGINFIPDHIKFIIDLLLDVRTLTFEDRYFSTGLIITKSIKNYTDGNRNGTYIALSKKESFSHSKVDDRRFWSLVDGHTCYYLVDSTLTIQGIFFLNNDKKLISVSSLSLKNTLKGSDVAFQTDLGKELNITNAQGMEFTFNGSHWNFKHFTKIINCVTSLLPNFDDLSIERLIDFVLAMIRERNSSLIWIPLRLDDIEIFTLSSVDFLSSPIQINRTHFSGHIKRILSSDGATILSDNGRIIKIGAVADLSKITLKDGRTGTGSMAAKVLSQSGISIKISQDGFAKFYKMGNLVLTI